jgi:hypothetical protein
MDAVVAEIANSKLPPVAAASLFIELEIFDALIWRFRAARLGPFASKP